MGLLKFLGLMVCVGIVLVYLLRVLFIMMVLDVHEDFYEDI